MQGLPEPLGFFTMCKGLAHGEEEGRIIPADSMAANSFLADSSFSASKSGGPGNMGTVWRTGCLVSVVKKPLEETTSGYLNRRSLNSWFQGRGVKETRTCDINQEVIVAWKI